ncbi:MAG: valine--tRNA ligase [Candidatus Rokubacteria bacterium]|nr:valine--tRNA ligase [Candidatus Rokubacteria bacterium]
MGSRGGPGFTPGPERGGRGGPVSGPPQIPDRYEPAAVEARWYPEWEKRGYFNAEADDPRPPYCIVIPPPNVTGSLHMGHALVNTLQDVLIRMKRMDGFNALWLPGTDHAGIATQYVVERQLAAEGKRKEDLGYDGFLTRVLQWKDESGGTIIRQLKRLGASCDWRRERFTMDPGLSRAVREAFVRLYDEGLIYRDDYIVNWCPRCQTVLADLEVEREDRDAEFVYIKYGPLTLGTVRPETKLGDTGLAVHPGDARYAQYVGQTLEIPSVDGTISVKVVADEAVDPEFGTGVIKVTPGHDPTDFEIGRRHGLPIRTVIGFDGKMTAAAGKYAGMDRFETRKKIVEDMQALGLIDRIEPYRHAVGVCYRCKTVVEPLVSKQWYVNVKPLAEAADAAAGDGRITVLPSNWAKVFHHWMANIRPWCVSRQLWWGHRIPAWYCDREEKVFVSRTDLASCPSCQGALRQETDVLDTWFSSGLWPFSTLGWPEDTQDLRTFYPTAVLVTGYDILTFWVARMAMLGMRLAGDVPFRDVYIHTLVRDPEGQKMSKTKGNVVDPLDLLDKYGTDALRFMLASMVMPAARDIRVSDDRLEGARNFANKLWNAARLVLSNLDGYDPGAGTAGGESVADRWIRDRLATTVTEVREALEKYRFNDAASSLYQFVWSDYCDWYLEIAKRSLYRPESPAARQATQHTLVTVLEETLRLLHPLMPFITEEIWQRLPHEGDSIMIAPYPKAAAVAADPEADRFVTLVMGAITAIRTIRGEMRISPATTLNVTVKPHGSDTATFTQHRALVEGLARASVAVDAAATRPKGSALGVVGASELYVALAGVVDVAAERQRLQKEIKRAADTIGFTRGKLGRPDFVDRAPAEIVEKERDKLAEQEALHAKLLASLAWLD